jgi:CubicO group peptidase (beta-lactamase class C family)
VGGEIQIIIKWSNFMNTYVFTYRFLKIIFTIFLSGLILYPGLSVFAQSDPLNNIDFYIENSMAEWQIPGLAMAIVKGDKVIFNKGFGIRDINKTDGVDEYTQFAIASNTKAFTAHALGLLVQEGKITWDDPVLKHLPDFQLFDSLVTRKIVIRDLLSHRSGLGTWAGDWVWWGSIYSREDMMDRIRYIEPVSDFRTTYHYNNLTFLVAGQILSTVTGKSWDDFLKERIFSPLSMKQTNTSINDLDMSGNVAIPHSIRNGKVVAVPYVNVDISGPAGSINSCTADMVNWLRLQLKKGKYAGKQLITAEIVKETRKPHIMVPVSDAAKRVNPFSHFRAYGLGWFLMDYRGRLLIDHTGGLDGMYSYLGLLPDESIGVVIFTNLDNHNLMRALAYHVYDVLLEEDFQDWSKKYLAAAEEDRAKEKGKRKKGKKEGTKPTHEISGYLGQYSSELYGDVELYQDENEINIRLFPHPNVSGKIEHWQYDTFLVTWSDAGWGESHMYFDLDDMGEIKQFRMSVRPDWIDTLEYTFVMKR